MAKLKKLRLVNFGGYEDTTFNFTNSVGTIPLALFYGPNGSGKSSILDAIRIISNSKVFDDRANSAEVYLRPLIRDDDYIPYADAVLEKKKNNLRVEAIFTDGARDYEVILTETGFIKNELPERLSGPKMSSGGHIFYVDADNPIKWSNFQLIDLEAKKFIDLAEAIYGYEVDLDSDVKDSATGEDGVEIEHTYFQDIILFKGKDKNKKVHFARMSAGEKKIATMVRMLCNPDNTQDRDIILIDNLDLHIYYKRHAQTVDMLLNMFPDKQIICTSHSATQINHIREKYGDSYLFDLEVLKDNGSCNLNKDADFSPFKKVMKFFNLAWISNVLWHFLDDI